MQDDDDVDRRWRAANRVPAGISHTDASRELMDEIRARIVASSRPVKQRRPSRRWFPAGRRGLVLGSAIGVLAVGVAAAATVALTYTVDGSPGSCQTLTKATAGVSYPAGYRAWRNWVLLESADPKLGETLKEACGNGNQRQIEHWPRDAPALESIPVFRGEVAQSAFCAWASEWLSAKRSGDNVAASRAAGEIAGAIPWPAPNKDAERNRVSWFVPVQQAVRTDDLETVASMWAHKGRAPQVYQCWVYQPAPNSDNGTVFVRKPDVLKPGPHA